MILVDSSVWVDHFRASLPRLVEALMDVRVASHPFIIGELALGQLRRRAETIALLQQLPQVPAAPHAAVLAFIEQHNLAATGIGWVDAHLLYAVAANRLSIWTHDKPLRRQASRLGLLAE